MNIFLADLQNSYYRYIRNSVPIGMGYVSAYLDKRFGRDINVRQFRKFEEMHEALNECEPDLVAFGSYSWNTALTMRAAAYLRQRNPNLVIAVGGPDVSFAAERAAVDVRANPHVDFFIANEAELAMGELVQGSLAAPSFHAVRETAVAGCMSLDRAGGQVVGLPAPRIDDIEELPSPYLGGMMDRFLADPDYLPIIQTARGCPYQCTFCVSGKDMWRKVKGFSVDRVKAEIDYIAERASAKYLRLADENFGILQRDVEIAEYIAAKRATLGYPHAVSIYTDKHPTERVCEINSILKEMMPFCISFQSMSANVLENIKRINLKDDVIKKAVGYARQNDLMLVTELIFGLPGETLQSFIESIDRLIDYRFESIFLNQLRILKGTEMDLKEQREKYGFRSRFSMSENGLTRHSELENIEIDEWVVGTTTLSEEEYFLFNRFIFLFYVGHYHGYFKELLFLFENFGVRATALLMHVLHDPERFPQLNHFAGRFLDGFKTLLKPTLDEAQDYAKSTLDSGPQHLTGVYTLMESLTVELLMNDHLDAALKEIANAGKELFARNSDIALADIPATVSEQTEMVRTVCANNFIPLHRRVPTEITLESPYDLSAWIRSNYTGPLTDFRRSEPVKTSLAIRNPANFEESWNSSRDGDVQKYLRHFAAISSHNRRRWIKPVDQVSL